MLDSWSPYSPREEITLIRNKLESVDVRAKSVVASEEAIETAIYAMGEKAERYLSDISYGIEAGLEALAAAFEWGMAEVVYHLELQRKELKKIVEILEAPLETQARELRHRAEFAHRNNWIDEALMDFLEAESKNYADFTIHQSLGNIYLRKNDLTKALEYYEKAAKYARPHSSYYTSYALWHLGQVKYLQGEIGSAYEATKEATRLQPHLVQALYDHARYCALFTKEEESMANLREAIEIDRNYSLKALTDESFANMGEALRALLETFRQEAKRRAQNTLNVCHECLRLAADIDSDFKWHPAETNLRWLEEKVRNVEALIKKDSYFDFLDAEKLASYIRDDFVDKATRWLRSQIEIASNQIKDSESSIYDAQASLGRGLRFNWGAWGCGTAILGWPLLTMLLFGFTYELIGLHEDTAWPIALIGGILSAVFVLLLAYALTHGKHRSKYEQIIQSNSRKRQTLQNELSQLNSLYERVERLS